MELIENAGPELVKVFVELVPRKVYWAAVDVPTFAPFAKAFANTSLVKPLLKDVVRVRSWTAASVQSLSTRDVENEHSNRVSENKPKSRRCSAIAQSLIHETLSQKKIKVMYTDKVFTYQPLAKDFGPLDLSTTLRYVEFVDARLDTASAIIHISDFRFPNLCANSACLLSLYTMIRFNVASSVIKDRFEPIDLPPFRDASSAIICTFPLTIKHCCDGFSTGLRHNWINLDNFDVSETERLQSVEHGDMNWIIHNKVLAFAGPSSTCEDEDGLEVLPVNHYIPIFKNFNITDVIRLNVANYDGIEFTAHDINHHDLFFQDGSCPTLNIVDRFISIVENATGAVAVHCKAGLGRSVTLVGAYAMKRYGVDATSFIAWSRLARPGSVLGPQQHFLVELEDYLLDGRKVDNNNSTPKVPASHGSRSHIGKHGEHGQARVLLAQKRGLPVVRKSIEKKHSVSSVPRVYV